MVKEVLWYDSGSLQEIPKSDMTKDRHLHNDIKERNATRNAVIIDFNFPDIDQRTNATQMVGAKYFWK